MTGKTTMRAALARPRGFEVKDVPLPECGPREVRVRIEACGICGTDLHSFHNNLIPPGQTPGHEMAGVVDAVGGEVTDLPLGARVVVEPLHSCGECEHCASGRDSICPDVKLYGMHLAGGLAEYVAVPARRVFRAAEDLRPEVAALAEPIAVAVHGLKRGAFEKHQRVLVVGAGAIGQVTLLCARFFGAREVWVTARYPHQADAARTLGAARVLSESEASPQQLAELGRRSGFDLVVETVGGSADTLGVACAAARPGGVVSVLGLFLDPPRMNPLDPLMKELDLCWSNCYQRSTEGRADFEVAVGILDAERELLAHLTTHRFPLDQVGRAFETAASKSSGALKVTVCP